MDIEVASFRKFLESTTKAKAQETSRNQGNLSNPAKAQETARNQGNISNPPRPRRKKPLKIKN
ncbi:hypothetical protein Acr_00g0029930 [Actinidia rufa]|uniref:Uncharacterized protein n=1 Tax=Actinidia rufa TaxID=165716 RepID=A0A7J0DGJ4_9ERIC|nr:hypothetical protein Acr_00g0029930 [Actinidia rufa]